MDYAIEMADFKESPKFPRARLTSECSSSTSEPHSDDYTPKSKRHLKFTGKLLELPSSPPPYTTGSESPISPRTNPTYSGSNSPTIPFKTGANSSAKTKTKTVDIRTARGGQFSVAPKDASLLGRIAHKAPKKSARVLEPHEVFIELEELKLKSDSAEDLEWEETARWIKFEEDVEQEIGRWGRPHVSALSFHSLVDLRRGLEKGCVLLDVEGNNFPTIVDKIVDHLVDTNYLSEDLVGFVLQALYKRHKHQHQVTLWDDLKQAAKSADGKLHDLGDQLRHRYHHHSASIINNDAGVSQPVQKLLSSNEDQTNSVTFAVSSEEEGKTLPTQELNKLHRTHPSVASDMLPQDDDEQKLSRSMQDLLHKIPDDAESLTVLVGGVSFLQEPLVVFVRLKQSHLLGDLTEVPIPVRFIYLTLGPPDLMDYHEVGRAMATLMSDKHFHDMAYMSSAKEELMDAIDMFLGDSIVLPPGDWDQDLILPLMHERNELKKRKERKLEDSSYNVEDAVKFSCKPCGGMIRDVKNLVKRYPSDIKDVLHFQALIAIIFVYISCIAPAIAFGGLMEEVTGNLIGETETLVGTGLCGIVQGLFSVQPLAILAFTGPLLLFEEIIIEFAHLLHIEYLPWRACIGLWVMIVVIIFAVSETTFLVKSFTRFSEEIFTGVITLFFIVETIRTIIKIFERNPLCGIIYPCGGYTHCTNTCDCTVSNMTGLVDMGSGENFNDSINFDLPHAFNVCNQVNTALWSVFLCIAVFLIAVLLRKLRQSQFIGKQGRRLVSDFGMLTAIVTMVTLAYFLRNIIAVEVLVVPDGWKPSNSTARGWLINPIENLKVYHIIGAIVPAILLGILIFIENQLTLFLVNKPEHRLKKDVGYHFDLFIVGILTGLCGVLGLPWHCAASVRSIQHLQSLSFYSRRTAPGEKPSLEGVYEQRITNIAVHILIILSPFAYPILREIPFAVLLGVFLYLAYASFSGIQLRKRIKIFFTPPKHHPDVHYVRKVRTWKMNIYTLVQVILIGALFGLKLSPAGMFYPLAIVLLVPIRKLLGKYAFSHIELEALDSEEDFPDELDDDENEFAETHVPY